MVTFRSPLILCGALAASLVAGHGYVSGIVVDGTYYRGFRPDQDLYTTTPPAVIGWATTVTDNGFVAPDAYTTADIVCHRGAVPGKLSAPVRAGGTVEFQWTTWPDSHHGPVIEYLAPVSGDFASISKTSLQWFKSSQGGLVSGYNPGTWATDQLIANNISWTTTIPASIKPGNYVLRHEIIALHSAGNADGAQNYPQCINLVVSGSGSATPAGTPATSFYTPTTPGILFNLYTTFTSYPIPGPALYSG